MGIEPENFFGEVLRDLDAIDADDYLPFYLSGHPTNEAILRHLNPADRFLHNVAIGVRNDLPLHLRLIPSTDPFFQDRIINAVESILYDGVQKEAWAF